MKSALLAALLLGVVCCSVTPPIKLPPALGGIPAQPIPKWYPQEDCGQCLGGFGETHVVAFAIDPTCGALGEIAILKAQQQWWRATGGRIAWAEVPYNRFEWRRRDVVVFKCITDYTFFVWPYNEKPDTIGLWNEDDNSITLVGREARHLIDGEPLVIHEIGHMLGLKHPSPEEEDKLADEDTCMQHALIADCARDGVPAWDRVRVCQDRGWVCRQR